MQINSVLAGHPDPMTAGKRTEPLESVGRGPLETPPSRPASGAGPTPALGAIMAQYDVTNISAREFSEMIQKLHQAGALGDGDLRELALVRLDLDLNGIDPDRSTNLLQFYNERLREVQQRLQGLNTQADLTPAERSNLQQSQAMLRRRLDWLQKLATVHSSPDAVGLSALA